MHNGHAVTNARQQDQEQQMVHSFAAYLVLFFFSLFIL